MRFYRCEICLEKKDIDVDGCYEIPLEFYCICYECANNLAERELYALKKYKEKQDE